MNKIISIELYKKRRIETKEVKFSSYQRKIDAMSSDQLVEEMVHFQEKRAATGKLTPSLIIHGQILFEALEKNAKTKKLQALARSYHRHLKHELEHQRRKPCAKHSS
jgi:uncharacterized protein YejL (UPF0352 family)